MRSLLAFLTTLPLAAAWNYSVLSGATESSFVSRSIQLSDVFQERTFVTLWNDNQFRFARSTGTGTGNCGRSLE